MYPVTSKVRREVYYYRDLAPQGQPGATVTINHGLEYPPSVFLLKRVDNTWVDGTGTADISHNVDFTETTVANVTEFEMQYLIRLL